MPFLSFLLLFPLVGALVIACIPSWKVRAIKTIALCTSLINFIVACGLWLVFDNSTAKFQFVEHIGWLPFFNMNAYIGIDGISLFFIVLTTFLVPVCLLVGWVMPALTIISALFFKQKIDFSNLFGIVLISIGAYFTLK